MQVIFYILLKLDLERTCQRTIAEAVQTTHLKNMFADVEADLQRKRILRRVITWTSSTAASALAEARLMIEDGLRAPAADEESRYRHALLRRHLYEVDWLEAISLMKQGRYRKAYRLLESIAASPSPYSEKARRIIDGSL